jgi:hypothetical protein
VPSLAPRRARRALATAILLLGLPAATATGCKAKASASECDQLLERYAQLVVTERYPDASAAQIKTFHDQEKREALGDDAFKNCSSEVSRTEFDCAMRAPSADTFEKCLE